jgi:putative Flp pilus-assembly TadE/G-like protein
MTPLVRSERGAVLVHVSVSLAAFTIVSALAIDYGMVLVSRSQIQSAADAAALAGATALAFDSYSDRSSRGPARNAAIGVATANHVSSQPPDVTPADVTFPLCPDSFSAGPSVPPVFSCVRVDAFRSVERGNPLPTFFGQMFGINSASVAATATAQAKAANSTPCLKPLAIPDRWTERAPAPGPWLSTSAFEKWDPANPAVLLAPPDFYSPPRPTASGTGLTMTGDAGLRIVLSEATADGPPIPWSYHVVQIPGSRHGNDFRSNVEQCAGATVAIGDRLPLQPGGAGGLTATAMQALIDMDPFARWNATTNDIEGSCADSVSPCAAMSPRIIAVPLFDPADYADTRRAGATSVVVRNIVGVFVDSVSATSVTGYLVRHPGFIQSTAPTVIEASAFLRTIVLIE